MQLNNEKVKEKSEGKGVGKVGESLLVVASPNVQAELSNEATPGKIVFEEEVVLEAAIEAEDHVKKSEAAGLLAQVTSPWIENNCSIEGLSLHLDNLVASLTGRIKHHLQKSTTLIHFTIKRL